MRTRRATDDDASRVADIWLRSYDAALPTVTRAHSDDEVRRWIRETVVGSRETWVAEVGSTIVGLLVLHDDMIDQLYLDPDWRSLGVPVVCPSGRSR